MTRLILLNGVPGSGKSTLARRYVKDHRLALALDIDVIRSMLGGWIDYQAESGRAARAMALSMARTHLLAEHDVVVPQLLARVEFTDRLEQLAGDLGVPFDEVVLDVDVSTMLARFEQRSAQTSRPEHRDAAEIVRRAQGKAGLAAIHERLAALVATRPAARLLSSIEGDVERTFQHLNDPLEGRAASR